MGRPWPCTGLNGTQQTWTVARTAGKNSEEEEEEAAVGNPSAEAARLWRLTGPAAGRRLPAFLARDLTAESATTNSLRILLLVVLLNLLLIPLAEFVPESPAADLAVGPWVPDAVGSLLLMAAFLLAFPLLIYLLTAIQLFFFWGGVVSVVAGLPNSDPTVPAAAEPSCCVSCCFHSRRWSVPVLLLFLLLRLLQLYLLLLLLFLL